jgi:hypothetical protein
MPGLIQAKGLGLSPTGEVFAVSADTDIQKKKSRPPQKPEKPPEKEQPDPRGKPKSPPQEKEKRPPQKQPDPPPKEKRHRPPPEDDPPNYEPDYDPGYEYEPVETPPSPLPVPIRREGSSPLDIFSDIETGWKLENVNAILQHFGKGKVSISVGGIGLAEGRFSKSQSYYLLKDLFKYTLTKKFDFVQFRNVDNGQRRAYAVAERYYKRTDDGRLFKDKIYVSLNLEEERWVINEIKSIK